MKIVDKIYDNLHWALLLAPLPYLYAFLTRLTCGYDCPQYLYHFKHVSLKEVLISVEPLHYIIFKPFTYIVNEQIMINLSIVIILAVTTYGVYFLSRKLGLDKKSSLFAATMIATSMMAFHFNYNILRNSLAIMILPFFLAYYIQNKTLKSTSLLYLMSLAHRTTGLLLPIMMSYRIFRRDWRGLGIDVLVFMPIIIMFMLVNPGAEYGGQANFFQTQLQYILGTGLIPNIMENTRGVVLLGSLLFAAGLFGASMADKKMDLMIIMTTFLLGLTILMSVQLALRPLYYMIIPLAVLSGVLYSKMSKAGTLKKIGVILLIIGNIFSVFVYESGLPEHVSKEESQLIMGIDIPAGSPLVVPERLKFYTKYVGEGKYEILNVPPALENGDITEDLSWAESYYRAFQGINDYGEDIWLINASFGRPDGSMPSLVHLEHQEGQLILECC